MDKKARSYVSSELIIDSFDKIQPYFEDLKSRDLSSNSKIWKWLNDKSELESILSEDLAWRYIKMNCDTSDKNLADSFSFFISEIEPKLALEWNTLNKMFNNDEVLKRVDAAKLFTVIREAKKELDIFREENVPLEAEMQQLEQEYGVIASKMAIEYQGKELTLQQASNFLKDTDRTVREDIYKLVNNRRLQDTDKLNKLLTKLIKLRQKIAINAGFKNFRDYKFRAMGRFDYHVEDCKLFHSSVSKIVTPLVSDIIKERKNRLNYDVLNPWDLDVDPELKPALKPFTTSEELVKKAIFCFRDLEPEFGIYLNEMRRMGHLDLDSRKNKAPGGFNYPLHESDVPFIYMNATGNMRDMVTMLHEGGHAIHAFLAAKLELVEFKDTPSEIAELASMTMELISMDHWHHFFEDEEDLIRAKRTHLEDVISVLPWVATVDKFQHFLYENPKHSNEERTKAWTNILDEFSTNEVDYTGIESFRANQWQKQLHIFEVPFYYIEYGIAQLGAIAIWKNFRTDKYKALKQYKAALSMGYTSPLPDTYKAAGIEFNFSESYISELMEFVKEELSKLQ